MTASLLLFTLAGADRPLHFHRELPGGDERPGPAPGGDGAAGGGAGEEPEGLQGRSVASLLPSANLLPRHSARAAVLKQSRVSSFQIRRRSDCCWSGSACTTPGTSWCAETRSSVTCEWLRLRRCRRFWKGKKSGFLSFHLSNAPSFVASPSPGQCSRGWRRSRPTWSTSSGASSTNKVSVFSVVTFYLFKCHVSVIK